MTKKRQKTNSLEDSQGFESRDLEQSVLDKLDTDAELEAKMIANFNAKVNSPASQSEQSSDLAKKQSVDNDESAADDIEPTRYGDWQRKGRCFDF